MALKVLHSNDMLTISCNEESQIMYLDWKGEHNLETVQAGCEILLDMLKKVVCHKILNDNTNVKGSWSDASEWVATVCFPRLKKAGVKYFAWVYSPNTFSRLSTNETLNLNKSVVAVTFQDLDAAKKWLESV